MTLPALASVSQLETRLGIEVGSLEDLDLARAQACLADASELVRAEAGVDWISDLGEPNAPDVVVGVVVRAALRGFRNPDGVGSESLGGVYTYSFASGEASIYLTASEIDIVKKAATRSSKWTGTGTLRVPSSYFDPVTPTNSLDAWGL